MPHHFRAAVCLFLALACPGIASLTAQQRSLGDVARDNAAARATTAIEPSPAGEARRWRTEQEWIVSSVVAAIANIGAYATGTAPAGAVAMKTAAAPAEGMSIAISDHIGHPRRTCRLPGQRSADRPHQPVATRRWSTQRWRRHGTSSHGDSENTEKDRFSSLLFCFSVFSVISAPPCRLCSVPPSPHLVLRHPSISWLPPLGGREDVARV